MPYRQHDGKNFVAEKFIHVPKINDLEDRLEKLAIVEVCPWIAKHKALTTILDVLGLVLLLSLRNQLYLLCFGKNRT